MGHKTHPLGFRLGITQEHKSFWYSDFKQYSVLIEEDDKIRTNVIEFLRSKNVKFLAASKILIHRKDNKIKVEIKTTQPGVVVGVKGSTLIQLYEKKLGPAQRTFRYPQYPRPVQQTSDGAMHR